MLKNYSINKKIIQFKYFEYLDMKGYQILFLNNVNSQLIFCGYYKDKDKFGVNVHQNYETLDNFDKFVGSTINKIEIYKNEIGIHQSLNIDVITDIGYFTISVYSLYDYEQINLCRFGLRIFDKVYKYKM
jgi:hypothetical protein